MNLVDWIGTLGVFQILLAYILNIIGKMNKQSISFILLNLAGAAMACAASILMRYWPFIILEGTWATVTSISLINYLKKKINGRRN